jgi:3-hydroxyacyl-[acyl-carrier-protein] dehydratase
MKYRQLDQIVSIEPGKRLIATRTLRADEEYLHDHFPRFPVMPGVMMLEALSQAAFWLIHVSDQFAHPLVLLREVRSVKFGDFLAPGETLTITAETVKDDGRVATIKANAMKQDRVTVSGRLLLERSQPLTDWGDPRQTGGYVETQFRELFGDPATVAAAV